MPITRLGSGFAAAFVAVALAMAAPASVAPHADPSPDDTVVPAASSADSTPVSVAVVMPLTVPPTTTGLLDAETLTDYTQQGGLLDRELDAVAGTSAAIGIDPMITASIGVLGSSAPEPALEFLARLRILSNEVFLLAYADADPALAAVAGTTDALAPLGFGSLLDAANFGPAATPTPDPTASVGPSTTPTPDPNDTVPDPNAPPPLPTTEDLLAWPTTLPVIAWPAEGTVTDAGLAGLVAQGYPDALLSGGNVSESVSAVVDVGDIDALVIDDALSAAVRDAVYAPSELEYAAAEVTLAAALRAASITAPGRTLIATLDRRWVFGTPRLAQVLNSIDLDDSAQLVRLGAVLQGAKSSGSLVPSAVDDVARAATLSALATAAADEATYLSISEDAAVITEPRRLSLLGLSAVGWRGDDPGWRTGAEAALTGAQATLDSVQIVDGSDQLLLSGVSSLRLQVSNALPVAVTVNLTVRALRPLLHFERPTVSVTIEPDSTSTASVPVEAIINGDVSVRAELHAPNGRAIGSATFLTVIVQAGWETVGTVIAGVLVVLIFGGGLVRSILRRRRDAAATAGSDD